MRKTTPFCMLFLLLFGFQSVRSQTPQRPTGLSAKRLFIDYHSPMAGEFMNPMDFTGGWEIAFSRNLDKYFNIVVPFQIGLAHYPGEFDNRTLVGLDLLIQGQLYHPDRLIIPYGVVGIGTHLIVDDDPNVQIPVGLGAHYRVGPWAYLNTQFEYRQSLSHRSNLQFGVGLQFMFGGPAHEVNPVLDDKVLDEELEEERVDTDKDGIADGDDECPDIPGIIALAGCPDTDLDQVADHLDKCPDTPGLLENEGCPVADQDGDGVADDRDRCPDLKGPAYLFGCPDADQDGVTDHEDRCPSEPGSIEREGCPVVDLDNDGFEDWEDDCPQDSGPVRGCPDADGDGVTDYEDQCPGLPGLRNLNGCPDSDYDGVTDAEDRCPDVVGLIENKGCPAIKKEEEAILARAMESVRFETGSSRLKPESYKILDELLFVMLNNPQYSLIIKGHTDNTGNQQSNLLLSEQRAESCMNYLLAKGIASTRLSYIGYGASMPLSDNSTLEGRRLNRRVEFNLKIK